MDFEVHKGMFKSHKSFIKLTLMQCFSLFVLKGAGTFSLRHFKTNRLMIFLLGKIDKKY